MNHVTKIVRKTVLSDGAIAVHARCCDDPLTESGLTIYLKSTMTAEEIKTLVASHHVRVRSQHEVMQRASMLIDTL